MSFSVWIKFQVLDWHFHTSDCCFCSVIGNLQKVVDEGKQAEKSEEKPGEKSEEKPAEKSEDKSAEAQKGEDKKEETKSEEENKGVWFGGKERWELKFVQTTFWQCI